MLRALLVVFALSAPLLADDKPKPRVRLLGTVAVDRPVTRIHWTPDSKHLILITDDKGLVVARDQFGDDAAAKPVVEFALPANGGIQFALTPDGTELCAVAAAGGRFNAETRLCSWTLKDLLDGKGKAKPDRMVSLEADNPDWFTLSADGKSLFAVLVEPRAGGPAIGGLPQVVGKVVRANAKTGDTAEAVADLTITDASLLGASLHAASGRVFAHFQTADEHVVRCLDVATGKKKWDWRAESPAANLDGQPPRVSPDGKAVVAFVSRQGPRDLDRPLPPPRLGPDREPIAFGGVRGTRPVLLAGETGKLIADLGGDDATSGDVADFSYDGKLLFGWVSSQEGVRYVAWDAASGKPLKTWNRGAGVDAAAFAPGRYELACAERPDHGLLPPRDLLPRFDLRRASAYPPERDRDPVRPNTPTATGCVVGIWDLAPLVK
ncbi:MAG: hypothetical protein MUF18_10510 [Fimbriiglobus sp.]|jgi:outer membrane protein assembly factor BamB|nr:hypothetical protein [Fimbriiglobus sp.]